MKSYDKIPYWNQGLFDQDCIAFDKIDGSNMRFEWGRKRGWYKFGTRSIMIDRSSEHLGKGIDIFLDKYGDNLDRVFREKYKRVESFVVFAEFVGENSFAGQHEESDKKDVILFDVSQYKRGIISPYEFVENFGHLHIPKIIYNGKYTYEFIDSIKNNDFNLKEGVICKGMTKTKKDGNIIWMSKVKSLQWLEEVRKKFGNKALLEELNNDVELFNSLS